MTYTVADFDSEKRLEKSLRKYLNGINGIIKKTKSDMPGHYYETKYDLNRYFEREYYDIYERTQEIVAINENIRRSRRPYLANCFDEFENDIQPDSRSVEQHKLYNVIRKLKGKLYKTDDEIVEFYKQLEHARGKKARAAIQKKINDNENEWASSTVIGTESPNT